MKYLFFFFIYITAFSTQAIDSKINGDISDVITLDSWKDDEYRNDVTPYYRFRALKYDPIKSESGGRLVVEKVYRGSVGSDYQVFFSDEIELLANKSMQDELKKQHFESIIGCCHATDIKWDAFKLTYYVKVTNKYKCEIENVNKSRKPVCRKET